MRETSCASRKYCPDVGRSRQPTMCMKVDLPDPDGPVTATNSPRWTSRFTPRNALTSTSPTTYVLTRLLTAMTVDMNLPAPPAATRPAEAARASALVRHERVPCAGPRRCRPCTSQDHAGHDFHVLLQLTTQQFGVGSIGDACPHVHWFQLFVHEEPHATARFHRRQRRKERIDRFPGLLGAVLGSHRRRGRGRLRRRLWDQFLELARILATRLHSLDELFLLVGGHALEALEHASSSLGIVCAAAPRPAATAAAKPAAALAARLVAPHAAVAHASAGRRALVPARTATAFRCRRPLCRCRWRPRRT